MRTRALCTGLLTGAIVLFGAPAAFAATTAAFNSGTGVLTVTNDAASESITVDQTGGFALVTAPGFAATDPDGAGTDCSNVSTTSVRCTVAATANVVVHGGDGNDTIVVSGSVVSFDTHALGEVGNDTLTGSADTQLTGGDGNDTLNAGTGSLGTDDTGDAGDDTFNGSAQLDDDFRSEAGNDTYNGGTRVPTASETVDDAATYQRFNAPDTMSYSAAPTSVTVSLDGVANDGTAGEADSVAPDVEVVFGGTGSDTLSAGSQSAELIGQDGNDTITGGPQDDTLLGSAGSDTIAGGAGNDDLDDGDFTSSDSAFVYPAAAGVDSLDGGAGNDALSSDRGADNLVGGPGVDSVTLSSFDAPFFDGVTRPIPQASVTTPVQPAGFTVSLDDVANDGVTGAAEGDNVHSDIETVLTGRGPDGVSGSAGPNTISTNGGNDVVNAGAGADIVDLGDGDDSVNAVDQTTDRIDCGKGTDSAALDLAGFQPLRADVAFDCETISGQAFGAVVPAVNTTKPVLKLKTKTVKVKTFLKNRTLPIAVTCSKVCKLSGEAFTLKAGLRVTAKVGQFKIGAATLAAKAGTRTLKIKVALKYMKTYKRKLRTKHQRKLGISFILAVTASDPIGIQASANKTIKVKG